MSSSVALEKILETNFYKVWWSAEYRLFKTVWAEKAKHMTDNEFQHHIRMFAQKVVELKPRLSFVDSRSGHFVIDSGLQAWHDNEIVPMYIQNEMRKMAFVLPENLFEALSLEQTFDEKEAKKLDVKLFGNYETAWEWIIS